MRLDETFIVWTNNDRMEKTLLSSDAKIVAFVGDFVANTVYGITVRGCKPDDDERDLTDLADMFQRETGCNDEARNEFISLMKHISITIKNGLEL